MTLQDDIDILNGIKARFKHRMYKRVVNVSVGLVAKRSDQIGVTEDLEMAIRLLNELLKVTNVSNDTLDQM